MGMTITRPNGYYSVIVPFVESRPTKWHPTDRLGPFSRLSRGAFATAEQALAWGRWHLGGHLFEIKFFDLDGGE